MDHFLGNWRNWGKVSSDDDETEFSAKRTGWADDEIDSDFSDSEWMVKKRPGMFGKAEPGDGEEWTDWEDDKAAEDSDDDDQGGHMMPIPN